MSRMRFGGKDADVVRAITEPDEITADVLLEESKLTVQIIIDARALNVCKSSLIHTNG